MNRGSVNCVASPANAPPAIKSRKRSSRCCESSSTISVSRVGERRSDDNRVHTSRAQSGMFDSRDAPHGLHECGPRLSLLCKHASPFSRDLVEPATPLGGLFDPGALDPSTLLEAIEQGIERIDVERQLASGSRLDQPAQVVTMPGPRVEQREDEQLRGSLLQLAVECAGV